MEITARHQTVIRITHQPLVHLTGRQWGEVYDELESAFDQVNIKHGSGNETLLVSKALIADHEIPRFLKENCPQFWSHTQAEKP